MSKSNPKQHSVADRLAQFGAAAELRLMPDFSRLKQPFPPEKLAILGFKHEKLLEIWVFYEKTGWKHLKTYPILGLSGFLGPKLREGDKQSPEGIYAIQSLQPNSRFHLALRINYPNKTDRLHAQAEGRTNPGGDIMIHGGTFSAGCIAIGDTAAEELFVLAARTGIQHIRVLLSPVDFRTRDLPYNLPPMPSWTPQIHAILRQELSTFRPKTEFSEKRKRFSTGLVGF